MKSFIYVVFILTAFAISVAAQTQNPVKTVVNNLSEDDLIREIVFKKILEPFCLKPNKNLKVCYLSVDGGQDPSKDLLKKFSNYKVSVKKSSDLIVSVENGDIMLNENSKEQGVLFTVSKLEWKSKIEVKVSAVSYIGNMGGNGCDYTLKKENSKWRILSTEKCYVS